MEMGVSSAAWRLDPVMGARCDSEPVMRCHEHGMDRDLHLELSDEKLIQHLQAERIPFVSFDRAEAYSSLYGAHWTPAGYRLVAECLFGLLVENNMVPADHAQH